MRAFPQGFPRDGVKVAGDSREPRNTIGADFGASPATLSNWLRQADIEDGARDGVTREQAEDLRQLRRCHRLLEQQNEAPRRAAAYLSQATLKLGGFPE